MDKLKIKFDSLASHDITFVGIVQTAKASGMERFPLPYVLTNCHNSLCAVGGTINVMTMFLVYRQLSVMAVFLCLRILRSSINICVR
ncbi:putative hydratase [Shigella sonnei]|nr:putative hydratase [Shigella sonnei]